MCKDNLERKYKEGYEAFSRVQWRRGYAHQVSNPVKPDSKYTHSAHREWQRGWNTAYFENLEKLNGLGASS